MKTTKAPITAASSLATQPECTASQIATPTAANHCSPATVAQRLRQLVRSPRGPARGSRQVTYWTMRQRSTVARMPGSTPAAKSFPILVSVMMP